MSTMQIELTDRQQEALKTLARNRKSTPEQLVKEAVDRVAAEAEVDEHQKFLLWREALLGVEGMWKDRDDLPDFAEIRKSWDRDVWNR